MSAAKPDQLTPARLKPGRLKPGRMSKAEARTRSAASAVVWPHDWTKVKTRAKTRASTQVMPANCRLGANDGPAAYRRQRQRRERRGRLAELFACTLLLLKGYRILDRRLKGPFGEIDIVASRGHELSFVEVKQRVDWNLAEAAITGDQVARIETAAEHWLARRPQYRDHRVSLDAILIDRRFLPRHKRRALHAW